MDEIERCILVKPEVFVYKIPPRQSARGYRADDWNLTSPDWTGRLRITTRGSGCEIKLEDKSKGELFAACPVEQYPGMSVESVTDSSRYFVVCVRDSGRKAYIGIGFADRSDSFDFNVALQDHFKLLKKESEIAEESTCTVPKLDLAFKDGQTIRINIPKRNGGEGGAAAARNNAAAARSTAGVLPPPPGGAAGGRIVPPPPTAGANNLTSMQSPSDPVPLPVINDSASSASASTNVDLLGGELEDHRHVAPPAGNAVPSDDPWGDFASAPANKQASSGNWETF